MQYSSQEEQQLRQDMLHEFMEQAASRTTRGLRAEKEASMPNRFAADMAFTVASSGMKGRRG